MGVWGPGNFDSDQARDYLLLIRRQLQKEITECFSEYERGDLDLDEGDRRLMPSIDILCLLCEHYKMWTDFDEATVKQWKNIYLQLYDTMIEEYGPKPLYKQERRKVIEETFTKLEDVCKPTSSM